MKMTSYGNLGVQKNKVEKEVEKEKKGWGKRFITLLMPLF